MLKSGEVLVWRAYLDRISEGSLPPLLPEETARAARFRFDELRRRYVRSHRVLRALLERLGLPAVFVRDHLGKPRFEGQGGIHFNLSRSHDIAVYAVAVGAEVGIDIERLRPLPEYLAIGERYLPPSQYAALLDSPAAGREREFFRLWTRLEATLKATGEGLYGAGQELSGAWTIEEIDAGEGYLAAVAARADGWRVIVQDFEESPNAR